MHQLCLLVLAIALAGCAAAPVTGSLNEPTPVPSAAAGPENPTAAPPTAAPPATGGFNPPTPATGGFNPSLRATLGYGQALGATFLAGADALAVGTTAGVLLLRLPDLSTLRFLPIDQGAYDLATSPGGQYLAVTQDRDGGPPQTLVLTAAGDPVLTVAGASPRFSPDARLLATDGYDSAASAWATTLTPVGGQSPDVQLIGGNAVFSPSGMIATTDGQAIFLWREDGEPLQSLPGRYADFSPDGTMLAIAGDQGLAVYRLGPGGPAPTAPLLSAPGFGNAVAFGEGGGRIFAVMDATLTGWSLPDGAQVAAYPGMGAEMMQFGPGGRLFAAVAAGGDAPPLVRLYRVRDGVEVYRGGENEGGSLSFSPDGARALVTTIAGEVRVIDAEQGQVAARPLAGYTHAALSDDGATVAAGGSGPTLTRWPIAGGDPAPPQAGQFAALEGISDLAFVDGQVVVEAARWSFAGGPDRYTATGWAPGATAGELLRVREPQTEGAFAFGDLGGLSAWDYSPASGAMAWTESDGALWIDSDGTPRRLGPVRGETGRLTVLAFSPDGGRLAIGTDSGSVILRGVPDGGPLALHPYPALGVATALAWSADGVWLATRYSDGTVLVGDPLDDDSPLRLNSQTAAFTPGPSDRLALSPDGALLAVSGRGGVQLFAVRGGSPLWHRAGPASSARFSADGRSLVVVRQGVVEVWVL